jgi:1-acyl-sn-glycerol-3-phosphate acyltransferase
MFIFAILLGILFPMLVLAVALGNSKIIKSAHYWANYTAKLSLFFFGVRIKTHNKNLIDSDGQYIYICNHRSYLDAILAGAVIPNFLKYLGKAEILSWPVIGFLMKHFYVPVWRKDKSHRSWSMQEMAEKVKTGCSFFICPEGTCNTSEEFFTKFYDGAFKLAIETGIPIVPLTFINTGELMPRNSFLLLPGRVEVYWHEPISASSITYENMEEVKQNIQEIMRKDLLLHHPMGKFKTT